MSIWKKSRLLVVLPLALVVLVGLYALCGFWLVPKLIRSHAIAYVHDEMGKQLSLGEIRFNPFTFELDLRDIAIADKAGDKPLVALRHFFADFDVSSLWKRAWTFRSVIVEQPYAHAVIRSDGSLNLAELAPKTQDDSPPPAVWIQRLDVKAGRVDFADHSLRMKPEKQLAPIGFHLRDFHTTAAGGGFRFDAASEQGERFAWRGKLSLQPLSSDGSFDIAGLKAATAYGFLSERIPFQLSGGSFDAAGTYRFSAASKAGTQLDVTLSKATATALTLRAQGMDADWVTVPSLAMLNPRFSLAQHRLDVDAVVIDGLRADAWREPDGAFNLERLLGTPAGTPAAVTPTSAKPSTSSTSATTPATPAAASRPDWQVALGRIEMKQAAIDFEDRTVKPAGKFKLAPLALTIRDVGLDMGKALPISVQATINGHAPVSIDGTVVPETAALDLQLDISRLPLRDVLSYLPSYPTLTLRGGSVAAKGRLTMAPASAPGPELGFDGNASINGFDLIEAAGKREFVSWERVDAEGLHYTAGPDAVAIRRVTARKPSARVVIAPDRSINLVSVLSTPSTTPTSTSSQQPTQASVPAPTSASPPPMPMRIDTLRLDDARMGFADYSIDPNFRAQIEALSGTIKGLSSADSAVADIDLKGQVVNQYSPVTIKGRMSPFAYDRDTDITMAFGNIELPIFNPYSGRFAGYAIAKGKLSTELHYRIDHRKLQAEHHVLIDQLEWGAATDSKEKVSLPVRLATALLKDRHGVIDLSLPINGTLDDPKFRIGPIVWQVIKNIIVKAVTAPFSFLGSLFAGAEDAQFVDFAPGSDAMDEATRTHLAALAKGLVDRPALKLDIPAGAATEADAAGIAQQRLEQALAGGGKPGEGKPDGGKEAKPAPALDTLDPGDQVDALAKLYKQVMGEKARPPEAVEDVAVADDASRKEKRAQRDTAEAGWMKQQLLAKYQPTPGELQALARHRAAAVQDALLAGGELEPTRVFIAANKVPTVHEGKVRLELGLE